VSPGPARILSQFWSPLCAVGSHGPLGPNAQICLSVFGASIVPARPRLLVVLWKGNYTHELVREAGTLAITVLAEGQEGLLAPLGLASGRHGPKLGGLEWRLTPEGDPVFDGGAGQVRARVIAEFDLGDATAFLAGVVGAVDGTGTPLRWQAAQQVVGEEFMRRWAEKSARDRVAAESLMRWLGDDAPQA
jgi:flavin reductase (DIM6/NTAB) family NADH-FMN oxidoreductase RutF